MFKHESLHKKLTTSTQNHRNYLSTIGLKERADAIKVNWFNTKEHSENKVNLDIFRKRTCVPEEVLSFNPREKNTVITTDPSVNENKSEDVRKILEIRLYPVLRELIQEYFLEVFLGTVNEMVAYYKSKNATILFEFIIPSSAIYYLAEKSDGAPFLIMSGLVGKENLIAQLLTLKLAEIEIRDLEIMGEVAHFKTIAMKDFNSAIQKFPDLKSRNHILIIAGCGLESMVNDIVQARLGEKLESSVDFKGNIISFIYCCLSDGSNGIIILNLQYGEITEDIVRLFLDNCNCSYLFSGGAGGYISNNQKEKPQIGTRVSVSKAQNSEGQVVEIDPFLKSENMSSSLHLHISSIFLETYTWLANVPKDSMTVDIETFYILRAIYKSDRQVQADCGIFISDYVGEQPLREYSSVFKEYSQVLTRFLNYIF